MADASGLTPGRFARFYVPLAATSLLLTATNPLVAAALARTFDPAASLAGYSVAFALTGALYSPLLVVQQVAATRLLDGGRIEPVRRFALATGVIFSFLALTVAFSPVGDWVFREVVGVTGRVHEEARSAMALFWPVPLLTGLRALHQGRLVAAHRTRPIALATGSRTVVLSVVAFALLVLAPGAWIGAAAFTLGLLVETVLVAMSPGDLPRRVPAGPGPEASRRERTEERILAFSTPLMLNVLLWWSTPLVINAVLARTPEPDSALAAFAVVEAVAWFLAAPVGQLQHVSIALVDGRSTHRRCRLWAAALAVSVAVVLGIVALPAVREVVLRVVFSLDPVILEATGRALPIAALYPLLYGHRQYFQGLFIRAGAPGTVGWGAVLRLASIMALAAFALEPLGHYGASLGVGLAVIGLVVEDVFLERRSHRHAFPALEGGVAMRGEAVPSA